MATRTRRISPPAIVVDDVVKHFGTVAAVDGVDFEVRPGTVFGLLGPNGAGKTTTVRILTTILQPDSGTASVLGIDVAREPQRVRSTIGLAGQYAAVDENLTGRENLRLMGKLTHLAKRDIGVRADELLERFALSDAGDRPVKTYSGGMRRRLDVAAALVHRPPVLFLDEPTTGLDPTGRSDLWALIEELVADQTTVLLTTQYLEEADRLADRIAVVDHGRVVAEGTSAELKGRLGTMVVEAAFKTQRAASQAAKALARLGPVDPSGDKRGLALKLNEGPREVMAAVRLLDDAGLEPERLVTREPTLDDVFLALTGHKAESDEEAVDESVTADPAQKRGAA